MKTIYEFDFQYPSIKRILSTLSETMEQVDKELDKASEQYQIDDGVYLLEELYGIAFVVVQTYITGTIADARHITESDEKYTKETLLKQHNDVVEGTTTTKMELCDAMANYYKHHEEWRDWKVTKRNERTLAILTSIGIKQFDGIPFEKAIGKLLPETTVFDLNPLLTLISNWRRKVIQTCIEGKKI